MRLSSRGVADFTASEYYLQWLRVLVWGGLKKTGIYEARTMEDQSLDRIAAFDEYPSCEICGSEEVEVELVAADGSRIVRCRICDLLFTSPRIEEDTWKRYLKEPSERSITFTENRLKYGLALPSETRYSMPNWYPKMIKKKTKVLEHIEKHLEGPLNRLHDVGCGVGFQILAAEEQGITASGNDLNGYACDVMEKRLGLTVYNEEIVDVPLPDSSLDAVIMDDYIEHTYHPRRDLEKSYSLLRPGGVLYIHTFHVGCRHFDEKREHWNCLFWNHTHHFNATTMKRLMLSIGYEICELDAPYESEGMTVIARKPQ